MVLGASALARPPMTQLGATNQASPATEQNQTTAPVVRMDPTPTFRMTVTSRTVRAVNYHHRSGATKLDFEGTSLMPGAHGQAKVESKQGYIAIEVEFDQLQKATSFGNEYLTYIMWAITPEGRSVNLGEVLLNGTNSKLDVTTDLQAFALVVTAEPYYAVRLPSNLVVLENVIRQDTVGATEAVDAKYELLERGGYIPTGYKFDPVVLSANLPLEFYEARNALRIAEAAGAGKYATASYENAVRLMKQAEGYATRKKVEKKPVITVSREVVQTAEDSREIAVKRIEAERLEAERTAAADREARAKAEAREASERRVSAEADTADAVRRRGEAERQSREAQAAAQQAARGQAEAEQARAAAQRQQQAAEAESERNRAAAAAADQQRQQADREREELRARLLQQFNTILETRDTARGLIVNMSDVLFDTGKYTLRPLAREKLAKISGIVLSYPALKLAIEGNTDSVGSDAYNQGLSEKRAEAVKDYLAQQGIPEAAMTTAGFGKTQPIASNTTAKGRQQNRRVELVVSGEVTGNKIGVLRMEPIGELTQP
jgi:outer membrane protein OmpA-like peptidoglycan-associated protein